MVHLLAEVTNQTPLTAAGSLQCLIILLSQHLSDKRAVREHPGHLERLIKGSKKEKRKAQKKKGALN